MAAAVVPPYTQRINYMQQPSYSAARPAATQLHSESGSPLPCMKPVRAATAAYALLHWNSSTAARCSTHSPK